MRLIAIEEHILPADVREAWAAAPPPHDPVSAFADGGDNGSRLADLGAVPVPVAKANPEALRTHLQAEIKKWDPIIKKAGQYAD